MKQTHEYINKSGITIKKMKTPERMSWYYIFNQVIQRRFKRLKNAMKDEGKKKERINEIKEQLITLKQTKNDKIQKIKLYQELENLTDLLKMDRLIINWYKAELLKEANLTG